MARGGNRCDADRCRPVAELRRQNVSSRGSRDQDCRAGKQRDGAGEADPAAHERAACRHHANDGGDERHEQRHRVGFAGLREEGEDEEEEDARGERQAQVLAGGEVAPRLPERPGRERQRGPGVPRQDPGEVGEVRERAAARAALKAGVLPVHRKRILRRSIRNREAAIRFLISDPYLKDHAGFQR